MLLLSCPLLVRCPMLSLWLLLRPVLLVPYPLLIMVPHPLRLRIAVGPPSVPVALMPRRLHCTAAGALPDRRLCG